MSATTMDVSALAAGEAESVPQERFTAALVRHQMTAGGSNVWLPVLGWLTSGAVTWHLGVWPLLVAGAVLYVALLVTQVRMRAAYQRAPGAHSSAGWLTRLRLFAFALGSNWGLWLALVIAFASPIEQAFLCALLGVLATSMLLIRGADLTGYRCAVLPMILLPVPALIWSGATVSMIMAASNVVFLAALDLMAREHGRAMRERERLLVDNERLIGEATRDRERLQVVLDNMDDGLMLFDAEFRWEMINRQLMEFQRFTPEVAYPGASGHDIIRFQAKRGDFGPAEDIEKMVDERVAAMRKPGGNHYTRKTASGRWIDFHFKPLPGGRLLAMYRDVSELKESEQELAAARATMQQVLDNMGDGVALYDSQGNWRFHNGAFRRFLDLSAEVMESHPNIRDIVRYQAERGDFGPTDDIAALAERRHGMFWASTRYVRKAADGITLEVEARTLADGGRLVTYRDITEITAARDAVEQARATMRTVLDNMGDGVALYAADGGLMFHNQAFRIFLGLSTEEIAEHGSVRGILGHLARRGEFGQLDDPQPEVERRFEALWARDEGGYVRSTSDGRILEVTMRRLADGARLATYRDITELKRGEVQLAEALAAAEDNAQTMRMLVAHLPVGAALLDDQLRVRAWNDKSADLVGMPREFAHEGRPYKDFIRYVWERGDHVGSEENFEDHYATRAAAIRRPGGLRYERRLPNGLDIDFQFRPLPGGGVLATFTDVTEERRRETQLAMAQAATEATLATVRTLITNLPFGAALLDADLKMSAWNDQSAILLDMPVDFPHVGRPYEDFARFTAERGDYTVRGSFAEHYAEFVRRMRQPGGLRYERVSPSGRRIDYQFRPLTDGGVLMTFNDVTEDRQREAQLTRARAETEATLETIRTLVLNLPFGTSLYDADLRLRVSNQFSADMIGMPRELTQPGRHYEDLLRYTWDRGDHSGSSETFEQHRDRRIAAIRQPGGLHYERQFPTGLTLDIHFRPLADGSVLLTLVDITERKKREVELAAARDAAREAQASAEASLATVRTLIENLPFGAILYDDKLKMRAWNTTVLDLLGAPAAEAKEGSSYKGAVHFLWQTGEVGQGREFEEFWKEWKGLVTAPGGYRYERLSRLGRHIDSRFRILSGGWLLATYFDISDAKQREADLSAARDAAREAQASAEASLATVRTLVENLPFGALLLDGELRIRAWNSILIELIELPQSITAEGFPYKEAQRFLWERGEVGKGLPFEQYYAELVARITAPGGLHAERRTAGGRHIDTRFRPLRDGWVLATFLDITEAKQREAELARARETLEDAISSLSDGFALHDEHDRLVMRNERYSLATSGVEGAMRVGDDYTTALRAMIAAGRAPFRDGKRAEEWIEQMVAAHRAGDSEREMRVAEGRWVRFAKRRTRAGGIVTIISDMTEAKTREVELERARAEAEATRKTMQTVLDSMTDGVTFYEADGKMSFINAATMRFHRLTPDILRDIHTFEDMARFQIMRGDLGPVPDDVESEIKRRIAGARASDGQSYARWTPDGRYLEFRFLQVADGATLSIHRDITELKEHEEALERERRRLVDAIEALPNGFVLFDAEDRLVLCNMRFHQYYAEIADITVPGVHVREMLTEAANRGAVSTGGKSVEAWVDERMAVRRKPGAPIETRQPNGRWIVIGEQRTREGGLAGIYTDISELKRREEELERARDEAEAANQSKSTFLATMSHEIRTPMNGVLGMMEILERQGIAENQRRTVATMRESAQALLRIIDDVLDFSRIEAGRLDLEEVEFSLSALIAGAVDTMRPQASKKKLTLAVEVEPGSHDALLGDPTRVRQLLFNLLGNALKFTERGSVTVLASATPLGGGDTEVKLVVRDTGIGMDAETVSRLFQPFAQADSSTTRRYGGSGLGLSIVRRLSQLMGGDVSVTSAPGLGSAFTVSLRIKAAPAESALRAVMEAQPMGRASRTTVSDARVLVVDDHPVNREVLAQQLLLLGIASDSAVDGAEALATWAPGRYAAILADMHMPVMDGFEMTRRLRAREIAEGLAPTPIVAVTANAMSGEAERCLAAGMDAFLAKPVSIEQLRTTLERWLPMDDAPAAEAEPAEEAEAFDPTVMGRLFGKDRKSIARVLGTFVDSVRDIEREIAEAASEGDTATLAGAAHKLKGAARTAGAAALGDIAASLELAARGGDLERCRTALGPLAAARRRTIAAIEAWRKEK